MLREEQYPGLPYYLLGGLFLVLSVGHLLATTDTLATTGFRGLLPILLSAGLIYAGYLFRTLEPSRKLVSQAGLILAVGGGFGATVAGYIVWLETDPFTIADLSYPVIVAGAAGALLATPITYYYVTSTQRLADLEARYAEAERMRKQLSILDRVLRHNLRNELNIITGWVAELPRTEDTKTAITARHVVDQHLARLETLSETARHIRQVFETDTRIRQNAPHVVEAVVTDVSAQTPEVPIRTDLPDAAPVLAHPEFEAAIREPIENAIEHNDTDTLTIDVSVTPAVELSDDTDLCRIDIQDTGRGLPALEVQTLTQPEETPLSHGRGLGLWLVYAIIDQSDGQLEFPDTDQGTTVRLWVPQAPPPTAERSRE